MCSVKIMVLFLDYRECMNTVQEEPSSQDSSRKGIIIKGIPKLPGKPLWKVNKLLQEENCNAIKNLEHQKKGGEYLNINNGSKLATICGDGKKFKTTKKPRYFC